VGGPLDADYSSTFFFLRGDANHDAVINGADEIIMNAHRGETSVGFNDGDFNYDGIIDSADEEILSQNFGTYVHAPPSAANALDVSSAGPTEKSLYLTWAAPTGATPDGYHIYRSSDGGLTYTLHNFVLGGENTTYEDKNLPDGAKFYYRVRAFTDEAGNSISTNSKWSVTNLPAPSALQATRIGDGSVQLAWNDNADNGTTEIWMKGGVTDDFVKIGDTGTDNNAVASYLVTGLNSATGYSFKLRCVTAAQTSTYSNTVDLMTLWPGIPGTLTAEASSTETTIQLDWLPTSQPIDTYIVYRSEDAGDTFDYLVETTEATYQDASAAEGVEYVYQVRSQATGNDPSEASNAAADMVLLSPDQLGVTNVTPTTVELSWRDNSNVEDGYAVYVDGEQVAGSGDIEGTATNISGGTFGYTVEDLDDARHYTIEVRTVKADRESFDSPTTQQTTPLFAPTNVRLEHVSSEGLTIAWEPSQSWFGSYEIYRVTGNTRTLIGTADADETTFAISVVTEGDDVTYAVQAVWDDDDNAATAPVTSAAAATETQTIPQGVPMRPSGLTVTPDGAHAMNLSWTNDSAIATAFRIERQHGNDEWEVIDQVDANQTTYSDETNVWSATAYSYRIVAMGEFSGAPNGGGGGGGGSPTPESEPSDEQLDVTDYGTGTALSWDDPEHPYLPDGITASWSGLDELDEERHNQSISVTLNNLPGHYALTAGIAGLVSASGSANKLTFTVGSDGEEQTYGGTSFEFEFSRTIESDASPITISLGGSGWSGTDWWKQGGLTVGLSRYRVSLASKRCSSATMSTCLHM
jgi:fibronectin type 3 domain-containing protein